MFVVAVVVVTPKTNNFHIIANGSVYIISAHFYLSSHSQNSYFVLFRTLSAHYAQHLYNTTTKNTKTNTTRQVNLQQIYILCIPIHSFSVYCRFCVRMPTFYLFPSLSPSLCTPCRIRSFRDAFQFDILVIAHFIHVFKSFHSQYDADFIRSVFAFYISHHCYVRPCPRPDMQPKNVYRWFVLISPFIKDAPERKKGEKMRLFFSVFVVVVFGLGYNEGFNLCLQKFTVNWYFIIKLHFGSFTLSEEKTTR